MIEFTGYVGLFIIDVFIALVSVKWRSSPENRVGPFGIKSLVFAMFVVFTLFAFWLLNLGG